MDSEKEKRFAEILARVDETLLTAQFGLRDMKSGDKERYRSALRNVIVFGRAVTFALQNLKGVDEVFFDEWYGPEQTRMKGMPLMKYFIEARNNIEKQGRVAVSAVAQVKFMDDASIAALGPPPPGAVSFFMGDPQGGSGWLVAQPDGSFLKYYVDIPESLGVVRQVFNDFPETDDPELVGKSVDFLCERYIGEISALVGRAHNRFAPQGGVGDPYGIKPNKRPVFRVVEGGKK